MLNTLFFGYLTLKWKRLARVLSILLYAIIFTLPFIYKSELDDMPIGGAIGFAILIGTPVLIMLVSWVLKPFIVKD